MPEILKDAYRRLISGAPEPVARTIRKSKMAFDIRKQRFLVPVEKLEQRYWAALQLLTHRCGSDAIGDYLEFGVYNGTSMLCMNRALERVALKHVRLFGFDSFEGLPDAEADDDIVWQPGWYQSDLEFTKNRLLSEGVPPARFHLEKGWFSDTLTPAFAADHSVRKASVIMVDCDLYESTVDAMRFCGPLIRDESIIFFDDWDSFGLAASKKGERRAFEEFLEREKCFAVEDFESYGRASKAVLIRRTY